MSASQQINLTLDQAISILKSYDCTKVTDPEPSLKLEQIRYSLKLTKSLSTSQNLGICADNFQQAFATLSCYLEALDYKLNLSQNKVLQSSEAVYLKFSTQKMSFYSDRYTGEYRGVLVSFQSEDDQIAGTYGHFPLDLFSLNNQ